MGFSFEYPTPLPSTKGWGSGWPNCQASKIIPHPIFQGGVRAEIHQLVEILVGELEDRGYDFHPGWSWGFGCRSTKASSGSTTQTPSFHSWGLALDFNAPVNVYGADRQNTQLGKADHAWVVKFMRDYGFFWLGPSIGDWMHFSFVGTPADAHQMTAKAEDELMKDPRVDDILEGMSDYLNDRPPGDKASTAETRTYKALKDAGSHPRPDTTAGMTETAARGLFAEIEHGHAVKGTTTSP